VIRLAIAPLSGSTTEKPMLWLISKYAITALMVVIISEAAKRSDRLGGLLAALPLVTILVLIWMKLEGQSQTKIAAHAWYTFWYVVPTLPMFILFPFLYQRTGFWLTLGLSCLITIVLFMLWAGFLKRFGIDLL
jgi:hypothetical protein